MHWSTVNGKMEAVTFDDTEALPMPAMDHTSQAHLHEWMKKFIALYNYNLRKEHVDAIEYRRAVNAVIVATLDEFKDTPTIPLSSFIIKVVEKTWFLMHPCKHLPTNITQATTASPDRRDAVAPTSGFEEAYQPPDDNPRRHPKCQSIQAPPLLSYASLKEWIDDIGSPLHALVEFVLDNLEEQFHTGITHWQLEH